MFDYTRREIHTTTNYSSKNIKQSISKIIPICQMQDIRTAPKHFATSLSILQKKDTAEYLNPLPSSDQARHHIIPDSILRNFIAKVRNNDRPTFEKLIAAVEESYIQYHNITQEELGNPRLLDLNYIRELPKTPKNNFLTLITYTKANDPAEYYNNMEKAFVWSPGNLVIGPRQRGADPGSEYDREAAHIAGIPLGTPRYLGPMVAEPTGQMALGEALSMMLHYIDGTIDRLNQNIIDTILILHIKRSISNGMGSMWR
ncbi:MAG: hypothetical protein K2K56_12340 [Lachnospiraceae bacterium]|nr:hypothetical protein [Lachnospiraceae bacterium]